MMMTSDELFDRTADFPHVLDRNGGRLRFELTVLRCVSDPRETAFARAFVRHYLDDVKDNLSFVELVERILANSPPAPELPKHMFAYDLPTPRSYTVEAALELHTQRIRSLWDKITFRVHEEGKHIPDFRAPYLFEFRVLALLIDDEIPTGDDRDRLLAASVFLVRRELEKVKRDFPNFVNWMIKDVLPNDGDLPPPPPVHECPKDSTLPSHPDAVLAFHRLRCSPAPAPNTDTVEGLAEHLVRLVSTLPMTVAMADLRRELDCLRLHPDCTYARAFVRRAYGMTEVPHEIGKDIDRLLSMARSDLPDDPVLQPYMLLAKHPTGPTATEAVVKNFHEKRIRTLFERLSAHGDDFIATGLKKSFEFDLLRWLELYHPGDNAKRLLSYSVLFVRRELASAPNKAAAAVIESLLQTIEVDPEITEIPATALIVPVPTMYNRTTAIDFHIERCRPVPPPPPAPALSQVVELPPVWLADSKRLYFPTRDWKTTDPALHRFEFRIEHEWTMQLTVCLRECPRIVLYDVKDGTMGAMDLHDKTGWHALVVPGGGETGPSIVTLSIPMQK